MAEYLSDDEDAFAELLAKKTDKELLREQKRCEEELQKAMTRNDTVSRLYEKLYEDNATGKVSDEWFMQLIDHIDVFETEGIGKNRTQRIVIYYRFVAMWRFRLRRGIRITKRIPAKESPSNTSQSRKQHNEKEQATACSLHQTVSE